MKRISEHVQADNPEVIRKLAKKLERLQVSSSKTFVFINVTIHFHRGEEFHSAGSWVFNQPQYPVTACDCTQFFFQTPENNAATNVQV